MSRYWLVVFVLGLSLVLAACPNESGNPVDGDAITGDGDQTDGDISDGDYDNNTNTRPVLRKTIGIDLGQVSSFVVVSGANSTVKSLTGFSGAMPGNTGINRILKDEGDTGSHLLALTLSGEVISVSMVEGGNSGAISEPQINRIYPTAAWIFFSTWDFRVFENHDDDTTTEINCTTIAARRADGALFCADLGIRSSGDNYGNAAPRVNNVQSNAAGDVVYIVSADSMNQDIIYKVHMDGDSGPSAVLLDPALHPNWMQVNAAGDLLVNFTPSGLDPTDAITRIYPVDGGDAFTLEGIVDGFGIPGEPGTTDQDTFYILSGGDMGGNFAGTMLLATKSESSFDVTSYTVTVPNEHNCGWLDRLTNGLYMICGFNLAIARVVQDGVVIEEPTLIPLEGVDRFLDVGGLPMRFAPGIMVIMTGDGATHKFVRHDGVAQQDIPLDADIDLLGYTVSTGGGINFLGISISANEKIIGTVEAGSTVVNILSKEGIDAADVAVFTRIN